MVVEICRNYDRLHGTQTQATVEVREVPPPAPAVVDPRFPQVPLVEVQPSAPSLSPEQQKVFDLIQQLAQQNADSAKRLEMLHKHQDELLQSHNATIALEQANSDRSNRLLAMLQQPQQKPQAALPTV